MRSIIFSASAGILFLTLALSACHETGGNTPGSVKDPVIDSASLVKKGQYLVAVIGCDDCHSPKKMGAHGPELIPELRLSGYPSSRPIATANAGEIKKGWVQLGGDLTSAAGPWGASFSANITSDETGIGNWSEQQFNTAIRKGKYKGLESGRDLLPPMPVAALRNLTDEDIRAIYYYLKTVPGVNNVPPAPIPPAQ
jgi:mono/diheme cytochrome c family protein